MGFAKFVGAGLGWTVGGPIGSILGFAFGSLIDGFRNGNTGHSKQNTSINDFEVSLLVLSAIVIKADGKIDPRELDFVRNYFVRLFGKERANNAFKIFNGVIKNNNISTRMICMQIQQHMNHSSRLQLLHYLFGIATADGNICTREITELKKIAGYLYISPQDFAAAHAAFSGQKQRAQSNTLNAYAILGISKSATNDEVKKAYRKMAKKHHPDKLQHLGPTHSKAAAEKFKSIATAYEQIQAERGL